MRNLEVLDLEAPLRSTAYVISRAPTIEPEVIDAEVFDAETKPELHVITTPPRLRARHQMWRWVLRACIVMTALVLAFVYLV